MNFIHLTSLKGERLRVNTDLIQLYYQSENMTYIVFGPGADIPVKETPEQIDRLLNL